MEELVGVMSPREVSEQALGRLLRESSEELWLAACPAERTRFAVEA